MSFFYKRLRFSNREYRGRNAMWKCHGGSRLEGAHPVLAATCDVHLFNKDNWCLNNDVYKVRNKMEQKRISTRLGDFLETRLQLWGNYVWIFFSNLMVGCCLAFELVCVSVLLHKIITLTLIFRHIKYKYFFRNLSEICDKR